MRVVAERILAPVAEAALIPNDFPLLFMGACCEPVDIIVHKKERHHAHIAVCTFHRAFAHKVRLVAAVCTHAGKISVKGRQHRAVKGLALAAVVARKAARV